MLTFSSPQTFFPQVNFFFQYTFAATSATIASGAVAERFQIRAYLIYVFIHSAFMYPMIAHFVWSEHGLMSARVRTQPFMGTDGVLDNAGSLVVHVSGRRQSRSPGTSNRGFENGRPYLLQLNE